MTLQLPHLCGRGLADLAFDAETHEWVFSFSGQCSLRVAAPWRMISESQIVAGCGDDGHWFGLEMPFDGRERVMRAIAGHVVSEASASEFGDLSVRFGSDSMLQVFNHSAGYEGWQLFGPGERIVVAQGGGRVLDSEKGEISFWRHE